MRALCLLGILFALGCKSETPPAEKCLGYTTPPGWAPAPSKTGAGVVLRGPESFTLAGREMRDTLLVRFVPSQDLSLDTFKDTVVRMTTAATANLAARTLTKGEHGLGVAKVEPPRVTPAKVGGEPAYRLQTSSTLTLGGRPVRMRSTSLMTKFGSDIVQATASYPESRAAKMSAVAEGFLASLQFDKCKK